MAHLLRIVGRADSKRRACKVQAGFAIMKGSQTHARPLDEPSLQHHSKSTRKRNTPMATISRQLAKWVAGLRYDDLPPDVVDRAKGVTLQCIASVLIGSQNGAGKQAVKMVVDEETGVKKGATVMVDGALVTKGGAAFANSRSEEHTS